MSYKESYEKYCEVRKLVLDYLGTNPGGMEDLANEIGIGLFTMSRIVRGERPLRDATLEKLENFFKDK